MGFLSKVAVVIVFAVAMGYLEASVAVYLRELYFPGGFSFPFHELPREALPVEIAREAATIVMLAAVGTLAGRRFWERFAWFIVAFGIWDIVYYAGLKIIINWPAHILEPDLLFLIPSVWVGPVVAPALVSVEMIVFGLLIARRIDRGGEFHPGMRSWALAVCATAIILFTFLRDTQASAGLSAPMPYSYPLLFAGLALYAWAYIAAGRSRPEDYRHPSRTGHA